MKRDLTFSQLRGEMFSDWTSELAKKPARRKLFGQLFQASLKYLGNVLKIAIDTIPTIFKWRCSLVSREIRRNNPLTSVEFQRVV